MFCHRKWHSSYHKTFQNKATFNKKPPEGGLFPTAAEAAVLLSLIAPKRKSANRYHAVVGPRNWYLWLRVISVLCCSIFYASPYINTHTQGITSLSYAFGSKHYQFKSARVLSFLSLKWRIYDASKTVQPFTFYCLKLTFNTATCLVRKAPFADVPTHLRLCTLPVFLASARQSDWCLFTPSTPFHSLHLEAAAAAPAAVLVTRVLVWFVWLELLNEVVEFELRLAHFRYRLSAPGEWENRGALDWRWCANVLLTPSANANCSKCNADVLLLLGRTRMHIYTWYEHCFDMLPGWTHVRNRIKVNPIRFSIVCAVRVERNVNRLGSVAVWFINSSTK